MSPVINTLHVKKLQSERFRTNTTVGDKQCRWATVLATCNNVGNRLRREKKKKIKRFLATRFSYEIKIKEQ